MPACRECYAATQRKSMLFCNQRDIYDLTVLALASMSMRRQFKLRRKHEAGPKSCVLAHSRAAHCYAQSRRPRAYWCDE